LRQEYALVLAGRVPAEHRPQLEASIAALGLTGRVLMPGYFDEADVPALYASAAALMFPSLYEGFGLPILEGMASGIPVLTSNASSCPEAAGGHAVLVDPLSVDDIARGIERTLALTPAARGAALAYAQSMTWARTAGLTLEVYRKAAAEPRRPR
jgi:glycosyltransferase involved in cell wall biosynthesis